MFDHFCPSDCTRAQQFAICQVDHRFGQPSLTVPSSPKCAGPVMKCVCLLYINHIGGHAAYAYGTYDRSDGAIFAISARTNTQIIDVFFPVCMALEASQCLIETNLKYNCSLQKMLHRNTLMLPVIFGKKTRSIVE